MFLEPIGHYNDTLDKFHNNYAKIIKICNVNYSVVSVNISKKNLGLKRLCTCQPFCCNSIWCWRKTHNICQSVRYY